MWQVAIEMAKRCGGDRASAMGLMGPDTLPAAIKPGSADRAEETEGCATRPTRLNQGPASAGCSIS